MTLKEHLKTPKGRLVAALVLLGISWIFLIFYFIGPLDSLFPSKASIEAKKSDLQKLKKENTSLKQKMKQHTALENQVKAIQDSSWTEKNGVIETDLRSRVQEAAQKADLKLSSLGSVKISKINNTLSYAEIDVQGMAPIEKIAAFLTQIQQVKPLLSWKRFDLRPDLRIRRGFQQNQQQNQQNVYYNGTLRLLYSGPQEVKK